MTTFCKEKTMHDFVGIIKQRTEIKGKMFNRYFVSSSGDLIGLPIGVYIHRVSQCQSIVVISSKVARQNGLPPFRAHYHDRSSQELALIKALEILNSNTTTKSPLVDSRPNDKLIRNYDDVKTPFGISFHLVNSGKKSAQLNFVVSYFDERKLMFLTKTVYCGTINTWKRNYENAYLKAVALRENSMKKYREKNHL